MHAYPIELRLNFWFFFPVGQREREQAKFGGCRVPHFGRERPFDCQCRFEPWRVRTRLSHGSGSQANSGKRLRGEVMDSLEGK